MLLQSFVALTAVSAVSARKNRKNAINAKTGDITAKSKLGNRILSKARALDGDNDFSWVANYSIKFHSCATSEEYGYYGGDGDNNNNNNNNYNVEQHFVHFKLCPSDSCASSCDGGADYVIDMNEFVEAYVEFQTNAQEYNCEMAVENCYYDDEYTCYQNAGLDYCGEEEEGAFRLEEAAECQEMEVDEDALAYYYYNQNGGNNNQYNQNNNNQNGEMQLFIGPYCASNGKAINLGVFMEETCTYPAEDGIYAQLNYGKELPYSSDNIVESDCISCTEPQDNNDENGDDQQDEVEIAEICEGLYEDSGKCESNLNVYYPNTNACEFINSLKVGSASGATSLFSNLTSKASEKMPNMNVTVKALAGTFAVTTVAMGGLAYYMYTKLQRKNVNLSAPL